MVEVLFGVGAVALTLVTFVVINHETRSTVEPGILEDQHPELCNHPLCEGVAT